MWRVMGKNCGLRRSDLGWELGASGALDVNIGTTEVFC